MEVFLQSLDQWALQVLMAIYHLLGVQDLPKQPDPHWQVIERWSPQPDGHYRLVLESATIQNECRSGRAKYIIFPQTYMAKQEVYTDDMRVYTNEMDKEWYLRSFLDRPVLSCDLFFKSTKIKFFVYGYIKYFSTINEWPKLSIFYPRGQIFYNLVYIVVGVLSAFISTIFFVITFFLKERSNQVLAMGVTIYLLMFSHYPGYAFAGHAALMHQIAMVSIATLAYIILFEKRVEILSNWLNLVFVGSMLFQIYVSWNRLNLIQLLVIVNATCALMLIFLNAVLIENNFEKKAIYFITFALGSRDLYKSQVLREGFLNLSLLCLALIFIMTYRIVRKIYRKNIGYIINEEKLAGDMRTLEKTRDINSKIKQILHDIKSPITSLNFILASPEKMNMNLIKIAIERLNYLVGSVHGDSNELLTDWYSLDILLKNLQSVKDEKNYIKGKIDIICNLGGEHPVFFNPDYIKVLFAELIDNSVKSNPDYFLNIEIRILYNGKLELEYFDDGVGVSEDMYEKIGKLGYSKNGSGLGLQNIIKIISSWGGEFHFLKVQNGFKCSISLLAKNA